jgi:hypothetical protein
LKQAAAIGEAPRKVERREDGFFPPHLADSIGRQMSERSITIGLVAALGAAPTLAAPPLTAERAIEAQQEGVRQAVGTAPCPRGADAGDIVVCGRRGPDPNRLPPGSRRAAGEPEPLLPGELPRAQSAYGTCLIACPHPVTITDRDVRKYGGRALRHVLGKDK